VTAPTLLSVEGVAVDLATPRGNLRAVDHVDLTIGAGRTLGIVGESGCGKTMLSRAILQLLPKKAKLSGRVMFDGQDLTSLNPEALRKLRGRSLAVVFQDPMTSLNPVLTIGQQIIEAIREHEPLSARAARARAIETQCWIAAAACWGRHFDGSGEPRFTYGHSLLCDPWGQVVALASDGVGWVTGRAERTITDKVRRDMPVLDHRKLA